MHANGRETNRSLRGQIPEEDEEKKVLPQRTQRFTEEERQFARPAIQESYHKRFGGESQPHENG